MAINTRSQGIVFVVCKNCGAILHEYRLGDPNNKSKFGGVPDPTKIALSKGGICEVCGSPILSKPQDIIFMPMKTFKSKFDIVTVRAKTGKEIKMLKVVEVVAQPLGVSPTGAVAHEPLENLGGTPASVDAEAIDAGNSIS